MLDDGSKGIPALLYTQQEAALPLSILWTVSSKHCRSCHPYLSTLLIKSNHLISDPLSSLPAAFIPQQVFVLIFLSSVVLPQVLTLLLLLSSTLQKCAPSFRSCHLWPSPKSRSPPPSPSSRLLLSHFPPLFPRRSPLPPPSLQSLPPSSPSWSCRMAAGRSTWRSTTEESGGSTPSG